MRIVWGGGLGLAAATALALATLCLSSGCSSVGYLAQSARGHIGLLMAARPIPDWLQDEQAPASLKQRLALSQRMREFAVSELHLPDNHSYRSYADLQRPAAVWNVVAAPELSLTLQTWCFPVVGCVGYRGYYSLAQAEQAAAELRQPEVEVAVYPVPAYSTLGKADFLGGDPLLNTFIGWPEGELARLMFHELSHQVVYVAGDTQFNESFATSVERLGGERWLSQHAGDAARRQYAEFDARRQDFRALIERHRQALVEVYAADLPAGAKRERKAAVMVALNSDYQQLRQERWGGFAGYDAFFARVNNAMLGVQGAYHGWVPAFDALFDREGRDFQRFYAAVAALARLPRTERDEALRALASLPNPASR